MSPAADQLRDWLLMVVPLRMAELRNRTPDQLMAVGRAQVDALGSRGDVLQYGGRGAGDAAAAMATGLAALALTAEGGVTFSGLHWCGAPHTECPSRTPVWRWLGVYELPVPAVPVPARPVEDVPLPDLDALRVRLEEVARDGR
ncbi:hypothetical protein [Thermomonospora umbrina]|uniref:Uncharacterized protein n=1 Tax=Thermomonospora umbrina TaxID=111806 RepID=A0A3D9T6E4_9ACTN|nr:hypothetical protein [Thermomonospora umbrina]REF00245.1 hypothetical protein DFJ69_5773 [Thermomonospora umbrina]